MSWTYAWKHMGIGLISFGVGAIFGYKDSKKGIIPMLVIALILGLFLGVDFNR